MQEHMVYTGATRPPLIMGVPLTPAVMLTVGCGLPIGWTFFFRAYFVFIVLLLIYLGAFIYMRQVTKDDAWKLRVIFMRVRMRLQKGTHRMKGGITYSPFAFEKRR